MTLYVLVTVGTTSFRALTDHITSPRTLSDLSSAGVTSLTIQHGAASLPPLPTLPNLPTITAFDYTPDLSAHLSAADLVITHAGAGTISEALRNGKKTLVVVNDALMHNHQAELAHAMASRGCCVMLYANQLAESFEQAVKSALALPIHRIQPPEKNPYALANVLAEQLRRPD